MMKKLKPHISIRNSLLLGWMVLFLGGFWETNGLMIAQPVTPTAVVHQLLEAFVVDSSSGKRAGIPTQKCATLPVFYYQQLRQQGGDVPSELQTLFDVRSTGAAFSIVSPKGYFRLYYDVVGPNAVSPVDTLPANGIPDYVERAALYLDSAWTREFIGLGFQPPPINPPNILYEVYFKDMNVYGYTATITSNPKTYIVLENDYVNFPPNTDPEGHQLGALKVTIAHELKHASQYVTSYWSEGNWVELDATHMEDVVFDEVNDYYNYLTAEGSPLMSPTVPLDDGGGGSYEDCIWHHYLTAKFSIEILKDFWWRRSSFRAESVLQTYEAVLQQYGSSLDSAFAEFAVWNFFTGVRARKDWGYPEAADYPTAQIQQIVDRFPVTLQLQQLKRLSAFLVGLTIPVEPRLPITLSRNSSVPLQWFVFQQSSGDDISVIPMVGDTTIPHVHWTTNSGGQLLGMVVSNGQMVSSAVASAVMSPPIFIEPLPFADTKQDTGSYFLQCRVWPYFSAIEDSSVQLVFSINNSSWDTVTALTVYDSTWYQAKLPAVSHGNVIHYYWLVTDTAGYQYTHPTTAPDSTLAFAVLPDTIAPEITILPIIDPALEETPLVFQAIIQDALSTVDTAWVEITQEGAVQGYRTYNDTYQAIWAVDTNSIAPGDSVRYRWVARDTEGNERVTSWQKFYWSRWFTISRTPNRVIPDNDWKGVRDTIDIIPAHFQMDNPIIARMDVGVRANHSWIGDLVIELTAPDGHTIRLMDHPGQGNFGSGANGPHIWFSDTADISIQDVVVNRDSLVQGVYQPYPDKLETFQRLGPVGQWVLTVWDDSPGDSGALEQWQLRMKIRPYRGVLTAIESPAKPISELSVFPSFPNPFNGSTVIPIKLHKQVQVEVIVYNILGQQVRHLVANKQLPAGFHRVTWDGRTNTGQLASSGVYFIHIKTPTSVFVQKTILIR